MFLLVLSCIALILGPILIGYVKITSKYFNILKTFIAVVIAGLVVVHIVPHAMEDAGTIAIFMTIIGFVVPILTEQIVRIQLSQLANYIVTILVLMALALHGFIDGTALVDHQIMHADNSHTHEDWLGFGVVLHRIPLGLTIWWITKAKFGPKIAVFILIGMMLITAIGAGFGKAWLHLISLDTIGIFQALMGGALLHIVVDDLKISIFKAHKS